MAPFDRARSKTASASAISKVRGFSTSTGKPCSTAARVISACSAGGGGDNDAVQVIGFYHLPPILMDFASRTGNPRAFGVAASEAGERYAVNPVDGPDKITAPRAGTDEAETKGFVVSAHVLPV